MIRKIMTSIKAWNFDRKIKALVSTVIVITTLTVLILSSLSYALSVTDQSRALLREGNRAVTAGFENSLDNYKSLAYSLVMDSSVQEYMANTDDVVSAYNARSVLRSTLNMYSALNFVALVDQKGNYLYNGVESLPATRFASVYSKDYQNCRYVIGTGMRLGYNKSYYSRNTLNVYFPVYDTTALGRERGLLCLCFNDNSLNQVLTYQDVSLHSSLAVIDGNGVSVAESSGGWSVHKIDVSNFSGSSGYCQTNGRFYFYQKISGWPFYVVSDVAVADLYAACTKTILFLLAFVACAVAMSLVIVNRTVRMLYKPLDKVVKKMDEVANGSLETRINEHNVGADFVKLVSGFNTMMDKIGKLMEQVKEEQHEMEQIRFNALQSQIKPHFLYNTLECVHWQAEADGNKEISTMVKALAHYYRICLSRGRDVVTLAEEIDCVHSYLIIQNMRYGNIIDSSVDIGPEFRNIQIPKLTLQPLVENSIYHGIKVKEGKRGRVTLTASRTDGDVWLTLADTGTGMTNEQAEEINAGISQFDESFGYGVRNVHRRIQLLYGEKYGLHYARNEMGGVTVTIRLPDRDLPSGEA